MIEPIWIILSIAFGIGLGWVLANLTLSRKHSKDKNKIQVLLHKNKTLETSIKSLKEDLQYERKQVIELNSNLASTEADYRNIQEKLFEQKEEIKDLRNIFSLEFKQLANQIFEEKSIKFTEHNKFNMDNLLKPLSERIVAFEKKVEDTNKENIARNSALQEQIKNLRELNQQITKEASNLTNALKGNYKQQGSWGEFILESILEKSGLIKNREYFSQESHLNDLGNRLQPDVIVKLPDNKNVIIDSKVSLIAYEKSLSSNHEKDREAFTKAHIHAIKKHLNNLSSKSYENIYGVTGLDFVLMFIPIEPAFSVAVQHDPHIFNDAYQQNIIIVSPSTLFATLRTISNIWKHEYQNKNAMEIAKQSGALYDKFVAFTNDLTKVGDSLESSRDSYKSAMNKLFEGKGNLISRTKKIKDLGVKTNKSIDYKSINRVIKNE